MFRRSFLSGKFEFVSGKCQGILFFPFCMNPEHVYKQNASGPRACKCAVTNLCKVQLGQGQGYALVFF